MTREQIETRIKKIWDKVYKIREKRSVLSNEEGNLNYELQKLYNKLRLCKDKKRHQFK